ncbi:MAG: serine hydrolase domain-containing protein [Cyclobacteriaceae bacterium]
MKQYICTASLIGCSLVCYFLFQNIIDWNFGWERVPPATFSKKSDGVEDQLYMNESKKAEQELKEIHFNSNAPAVSIAVSIQNKLVWSAAVGYQDIKNEIVADTTTQFRIGSTSKALTSLALGKLIEKENVNIDSSLQFYTGRFLNHPKITIRQLASHQSGIRNYSVCFCLPVWEYYRNKSFESVEASIADFETDQLLFQPGDQFSYSSYNFTALSLAMEKASGEMFTELMSHQVFRPLGMFHTQPDYKNRGRQLNKAVFYDIEEGKFKEASEVDLSNKWAGGGFLSTPSDLVRAGNALLNDGFLSSRTINQLTSPQKLNNGEINHQFYALGWRHNTTDSYFGGKRKVEMIHHGGMAVGSQSLLIVFPEYGLVISLLLNKTGQQGKFELFKWLKPIIEIFLESIESKGLEK